MSWGVSYNGITTDCSPLVLKNEALKNIYWMAKYYKI